MNGDAGSLVNLCLSVPIPLNTTRRADQNALFIILSNHRTSFDVSMRLPNRF
jgi:hypothetical protein